MGDVLTFAPRPKAVVPGEPAPMTEAEIRDRLGTALQTTLDAADHIIAVLDRMDGEPEDAGEAASVAVTVERSDGRVVALRRNDAAREAEAPSVGLPIVLQDAPARAVVTADPDVLPFAPLPWRGSGNVVAAAGVALLNIVVGR